MSPEDKPKIIEAQKFVVRDDKGKIRASLGIVTAWGEPVLALSDEEGVPRIYIELRDGSPTMRFMRPDGSPLFSFGATEDGSPILGLSRNNATPALLVIAEAGTDVKVGLCKANGEPVWLHLDDEKGHDRGDTDFPGQVGRTGDDIGADRKDG